MGLGPSAKNESAEIYSSGIIPIIIKQDVESQIIVKERRNIFIRNYPYIYQRRCCKSDNRERESNVI